MQDSRLESEDINEEHLDSITPSTSSPSDDQWKRHGGKPQPANVAPESIMSSPPTQHLHRQAYIIWLVLVYAAMLVTAWSILIVTSRHPIGRSSYGCFDSKSYCRWSSSWLASQNARTTQYINNAQTLLSAVSLLTIPLTSAVCAAAVIPWWQEAGQSMSLRQVITLADKGWTSPYIYYRLLTPSGWKRYGSSFVALALLLHAIGAALSPAINQMSSLVSVKVPTSANAPSVSGLVALHDMFENYGEDDSTAILKLREALKGVLPSQIQPRIWVPNVTRVDCNNDTSWSSNDDDKIPAMTQCSNGGLTYLSLIDQPEAWISQLGYGFSTGVKSYQHIPRVNTSVEVKLIDKLPAKCNSQQAVLLMNYAGTATEIVNDTTGEEWTTRDWWVKVCVLDYPEEPVFKDTDDSQTLVETAFLDLYNWAMGDAEAHNVSVITMSTTVGYFELPNYDNDNVPGPLLQKFQLPPTYKYTKRRSGHERRQDMAYTQSEGTITSSKNSSQSIPELETLPNKGPLLNIIYALFGNGSMPAIYGAENGTYNPGVAWNTVYDRTRNAPCLELVPLSSLSNALSKSSLWGPGYYSTTAKQCVTYYDLGLGNSMLYFLDNFFVPVDALAQLFRIAAYMSHDNWLSQTGYSLRIEYDPGQELQKPGLTRDSIIGLSLAIAIFLLSLLMLAFYASFSRTWTYSLDAYALLRIGAELGRESLPFVLVSDAHGIGELDELPGWVGDVTGEDAEKGSSKKARELGMAWSGTEARRIEAVRNKSRYLSYPEIRPRRSFDVYTRWITCVFSLGGLRHTSVGVKMMNARRLWHKSWLYKQFG